ncbi:hypothetical protein QMO17_34455, partial [Klebsiella pneumoniae]|nr:hypothetical protein [Klebsiella pneumoniae]
KEVLLLNLYDQNSKPGRSRVCRLWRVSIWRDDEPAVLDLDSHALSGREAGLLKPHAGDTQPRKKPWCSPGPAGFR